MLQSVKVNREMPDNRFYQPFEASDKSSKQQRKELDRWSDEGGSQTQVVNPDHQSDSLARNGSDANRSIRQSQKEQSSKSHKKTA